METETIIVLGDYFNEERFDCSHCAYCYYMGLLGLNNDKRNCPIYCSPEIKKEVNSTYSYILRHTSINNKTNAILYTGALKNRRSMKGDFTS